MKTRTDFVSNSSSSSFILKDAGFFEFFGITKQDLLDAIVELYGGKEHCEKLVKDEIAKLEKTLAETEPEDECSKWHIEYCNERLEELKTKGLNYWCVYDMTDEKDCEECYKEWDDHFSSWWAPNEGEAHEWEELIDMLHWKCDFSNITAVVNGDAAELVTSTYDRKANKHVCTPFPGGAAFIKHVKRKLAVKTMKEVLHDKYCTLMIHFADNEALALKGMSDYGKEDANDYRDDKHNAKCEASKWASRMYSAERFFEILIKYFIEKGKVNLADPEFLEYWKVRDDDDWYKKNYPDRKYYHLESDTATWRDVYEDVLGCNAIMHEG